MPKGIFKNGNSGLFKKGNPKSPKAFSFQFGHETSKETREKIGDSHRGEKNSMFGKHIPDEQKKRQSETSKRLGIKPPVMYGEKNPSWKGGVNPINDTIRKSFNMEIFKKDCLKRDNWTCQKTGIRGGKLVIHHILNFSNNSKLRFDINNGITLSKESHQNFHRIYGIKNNTREQLEEFLNKQQ